MSESRYELQRPSVDLEDLVEGVWIQEAEALDDAAEAGCVVPTGTVEIIFNCGDTIRHVTGTLHERMPRIYITGQRTRPVHPVIHGRVELLAVSLYPWGVAQLLPDCVEACDSYVDLRLTSAGGRAADLEEALLAAPSTETRIVLVEDFLRALRVSAQSDALMCHAAQRLIRGHDEYSVESLADELELSRRHFGRRFRAEVGVPPKKFSRIMRVQRALQARRIGDKGWAEIAAIGGFSDQAHLSHEIRRFCGRSPSKIERGRPASSDVFNRGGVSRFFETVYL